MDSGPRTEMPAILFHICCEPFLQRCGWSRFQVTPPTPLPSVPLPLFIPGHSWVTPPGPGSLLFNYPKRVSARIRVHNTGFPSTLGMWAQLTTNKIVYPSTVNTNTVFQTCCCALVGDYLLCTVGDPVCTRFLALIDFSAKMNLVCPHIIHKNDFRVMKTSVWPLSLEETHLCTIRIHLEITCTKVGIVM